METAWASGREICLGDGARCPSRGADPAPGLINFPINLASGSDRSRILPCDVLSCWNAASAICATGNRTLCRLALTHHAIDTPTRSACLCDLGLRRLR